MTVNDFAFGYRPERRRTWKSSPNSAAPAPKSMELEGSGVNVIFMMPMPAVEVVPSATQRVIIGLTSCTTPEPIGVRESYPEREISVGKVPSSAVTCTVPVVHLKFCAEGVLVTG